MEYACPYVAWANHDFQKHVVPGKQGSGLNRFNTAIYQRYSQSHVRISWYIHTKSLFPGETNSQKYGNCVDK